jgi:hypothetical protein
MWRDSLLNFIEGDDRHGDAITDLIADLAYWATNVATCKDPEIGCAPEAADQMKDFVKAIGTTIDAIAATIVKGGIDELNADIAALQGAATKGQTVWYLEMSWHGSIDRKYSQPIGETDFFTGWGDQPTDVMLLAIGENMRAQCAGFPSSPWGNSPGVLASQDSTYTDPCM